MSELAEDSTVIEASPAEVMDIITDYEAYPEWAEVKSATVLERGTGELATKVAFEVDVPILGKAAYTLAYQYAPGDAGLSWTTVEARGAVRDIRGEYLLTELGRHQTQVTYRLYVELGILMPGIVRTQGAKRVIENALEHLKRRVELG